RHEMPELDLRRLAAGDREHRDRLLPEDVRVVRPRVAVAVALGELDQLEPARKRRIRENGDAEIHRESPPRSMLRAYRGVARAASAARAPIATKPMRPSPGSENVSPTSGVPATITSEAQALMKPTAAPGAAGRARAAPVNAIANGTPAARPTTAAAITSSAYGRGRARTIAPAPASTRLAATHDGASARRSSGPPAARVKKPRRSVSDPATAALDFEWPWCSSSVTTVLPTTTLKPKDSAWIAASR